MAAFLAAAFTSPAFAKGTHYCDPAIKADLMNQAAQEYSQRAQEIENYWPQPTSIENMFCGGAFVNNQFSNILLNLGNSDLSSLISDFLKNKASELCQKAIQSVLTPISNSQAAINACTQQVNSPESYLELIARLDPKYLERVYNNPNYNACYLNRAIENWLKLHPGAK